MRKSPETDPEENFRDDNTKTAPLKYRAPFFIMLTAGRDKAGQMVNRSNQLNIRHWENVAGLV